MYLISDTMLSSCIISPVCGRGAPVQFHPGNLKYRELIKEFETSYLCAKRNDKPEIAMEVLEILKTRNVRFVKREKEECGMIWVEISEKRAYEKVCQSRKFLLFSTAMQIQFTI